MNGMARAVLVTLMTAMMVFVVTFIVSAINLGFPPDFLRQWAKVYVISWPVAAVSGYFAMPLARRTTEAIMARMAARRDGYAKPN